MNMFNYTKIPALLVASSFPFCGIARADTEQNNSQRVNLDKASLTAEKPYKPERLEAKIAQIGKIEIGGQYQISLSADENSDSLTAGWLKNQTSIAILKYSADASRALVSGLAADKPKVQIQGWIDVKNLETAEVTQKLKPQVGIIALEKLFILAHVYESDDASILVGRINKGSKVSIIKPSTDGAMYLISGTEETGKTIRGWVKSKEVQVTNPPK